VSQLILFNKPYGVVCQFSPAGTALTLKNFIPQADFYPAGRLDADSEGLVLLTDDGKFQQQITNPRHKLSKTYLVQVEGIPDGPALAQLRAGIRLREFQTRPAQARCIKQPEWLWPREPAVRFRRNIPTAWIEIILTEGRNRQVRRMTAAVGFPTLRLVRYSIGRWTLEELPPGTSRMVPGTLP